MSYLRSTRPLAALAAVLLLARPAPAQSDDLTRLDTSLKLVPADASFYSTSLRLGEQMDRFRQSNAYAKLHALPAIKYGDEQLLKLAAKPDNPLGQARLFFEQPANRELAGVLNDLWRREIFVYGGANWAQLLSVLQEVNAAQRFAPALAALGNRDPSQAQARAILRSLNEHADKLQAPELVLGFRISQAAPAEAQIQRLETVFTRLADRHDWLKGRVKRQQVAGVDALTLTLDGAMVPWQEIPWDKVEDEKGEYRKLRDKLKSLTLTVSLLVKGDYLLIATGPGTATVEKFGRGPALATRPELRPLAKFADRPLIDIGYTSPALSAASAFSGQDIDRMLETAKAALEKAPLSNERRQAITKDLQRLAQAMAAALPKPGASLSFTFLTPRGQEGYRYAYAAAGPTSGEPLTVLDHLGGSPLVAAAGRTSDPTPGYKELAQWVKVFYGHAEGVVKELAPEQVQQQFQTIMGTAKPFLKRFDEITATQLLPSLGGGQSAFVLDAQWTSKHWFPGLDQGDKSLPMLELGVVRSVKDPALLLKAYRSYGGLINDVLKLAREYGAPVGGEGIPQPEAKKVAAGTLYFWPLPAEGQDEQIQPNMGLSDQYQVCTLSLKHGERLLTATPLKAEGTPLAERRPVESAAVVNFAGLIGAVRPWVEQFGLPAALRHVPDSAPEGLKRDEIAAQVRTVLDVMQCLRGYTSATYRDGNATVTHSELVIRDLP
jgi:hypothetical protein